MLFALRNLIAPPRIDFARSPIVIVAIDEKTYRTEPFEGAPKVFWTKQIAKVIDALLEAEPADADKLAGLAARAARRLTFPGVLPQPSCRIYP